MDTLMDTLSQKLDAQEMIRANGEAESRQMDLLKSQVSEYMNCLDRMQHVCAELGELEGQIGKLSLPDNNMNQETVREITYHLSEVTKDANAKLSDQFVELTTDANEKLTSQISELTRDANDKLTSSFSEMTKDANDKLANSFSEMTRDANDKLASSFSEITKDANDKLASSFSEMTRDANDKLASHFSEMTRDANDKLTSHFSEITKDANEKLSNQFSELTKNTDEKLSKITEATKGQLDKLQGELLEKISTDDAMHKEGVRLYKNIQASICEEIDAVEETVKEVKRSVNASISGLKGLLIASIIMSALSLVLQILKMLNIF